MEYISSDTNVWIDFYKISKTQLPFRLLDRLLKENCIKKKEYHDCLLQLKNLLGNGIRLPEKEIDIRLADGKYERIEE